MQIDTKPAQRRITLMESLKLSIISSNNPLIFGGGKELTPNSFFLSEV